MYCTLLALSQIGDFGLACDMSDFETEGKSEKVPLPLRWTSLEVSSTTVYIHIILYHKYYLKKYTV